MSALGSKNIRIAEFPDFAFESKIVTANDIQRHFLVECNLHE